MGYWLGDQAFRGAIAGLVRLYAWCDLREQSIQPEAQFLGCLLNPQQALHIARSGGKMEACCVLPDRWIEEILALRDDSDFFSHYQRLGEWLEAAQARPALAAGLAQLCLHSPWPLSENAWLRLQEAWQPDSSLSDLGWRLLQLRLSRHQEGNDWLSALQWAWSAPWPQEPQETSWILRATGELVWEDHDEKLVPIDQWLSRPDAIPESCLLDLQALLARRHTRLLIQEPPELAEAERFRVSVNRFCHHGLSSGQEPRVRHALGWLDRFGSLSGPVRDLLLDLPGSLSQETRHEACWVAYRGCLEHAFRSQLLRSGALSSEHRRALALSTDRQTDWIGYLDDTNCCWLIDPVQLAESLESHDPARQLEALQWLSLFPFPELELAVQRVPTLPPLLALREAVLDLFDQRPKT